MLQAGAKVLVDEKDLWDGSQTGQPGEFPTTILIVNKKFAAEHPQTVEGLLKGHAESVQWLNDTPAAEKASKAQRRPQEGLRQGPAAERHRPLAAEHHVHRGPAGRFLYQKLLQDGVDAGSPTKQAELNGISSTSAPSTRVTKTKTSAACLARTSLPPAAAHHASRTKDGTMPVVLENLGKRFGDGAPVLDDVNATIGKVNSLPSSVRPAAASQPC